MYTDNIKRILIQTLTWLFDLPKQAIFESPNSFCLFAGLIGLSVSMKMDPSHYSTYELVPESICLFSFMNNSSRAELLERVHQRQSILLEETIEALLSEWH